MHTKRISMKIIHWCLIVVTIVNLSGATALGCNQVEDQIRSNCFFPNRCSQFFQMFSAIGGALGAGLCSMKICSEYCPVGSIALSTTFGLGSALVGITAGLGVAYVGIKTYESCVLRLQRRQNSDPEYPPLADASV